MPRLPRIPRIPSLESQIPSESPSRWWRRRGRLRAVGVRPVLRVRPPRVDPAAFSLEPQGTFVVADAPRRQERIQIFNTGWPLVDPTGGFYFVFQAGTPVFQKYDRTERLLWERHIEGREIDDLAAAQPTAWKRTAKGEWPLVSAIVRAAAVDPGGRLWVSFTVPFTYVFDRDGDKIATLQFRGAGVLAPTSLSFSSTTRLLVTPGLYEFRAPR